MEGAFFFFACASGGRKADCADLMLVCALFFRAAAWRSFSKQGLGVREEVGVLRPWGDLRPAAACVVDERFFAASGGRASAGIYFGFDGGSFAGGSGGEAGWVSIARDFPTPFAGGRQW